MFYLGDSDNRSDYMDTRLKGVHNHYNEYKDFHSRELEADICTSYI